MSQLAEVAGVERLVSAQPSAYVVRTDVWVPAQASQVFHALVLDEYQELWTSVPHLRCLCQSEARTGGAVRVHYGSGRVSGIALEGTFTLWEQDRGFACTIAPAGNKGQPHTVVVTLLSEGGGVVVSLVHLALGSSKDAAHMKAYWRAALNRLASLYRRVHSVSHCGVSNSSSTASRAADERTAAGV